MTVSGRIAALKERIGTKRALVVIALITAALLTSGVVFAAWLANGSGNGLAQAGTAQELEVTPGTPTDLLYPGGTAEVALRITNPNPYPVVVTDIDQNGDITSDTGICTPDNHGVTFTNQVGTWGVAAGGFTDISLPGAVAMSLDSVNACQGSVFTIPLSATGNAGEVAAAVDFDGDGFDSTVDCNDSDPSVYPGAVEIPGDGIDQDCDGSDATAVDADGDGFDSTVDCDDSDPNNFPGNFEVVDGRDNDCDGAVDEAPSVSTWYRDADGDAFGDLSDSITQASQPVGYVDNSQDCDDSNPLVNPAATEVAGNGIDDNCNGVIDEV